MSRARSGPPSWRRIAALDHLPPTRNPKPPLMPVPTHHADALKSRFRDVFGCRGREFGSLSRGVLGISDGNEGVQWNAGYYPRDGAIWLGVNLEGMKYDDWPVARLIEREISRPLLLTRYRRKVARPDKVTVLWARDAWQYSARRRIKEANVAPRRSRWIDSMIRAGRMFCEARGNAWTPGGNIAAAGRFRSRCSLRNGILGNDRLRWM